MNQASTDRAALTSAADRLAELKSLIEYQRLASLAQASPSPAHRAAAEQAWTLLADKWTARFASATLKPLSPEQFSWSIMQAAGTVERERAAALTVAKAKKKDASEAELAIEVEKTLYSKLNGNVNAFVTLFGSGAGQPQDFQASVNQALFMANAAPVQASLAPSAGGLTDRLVKLSDPIALGDEMYLSVFTRLPSDAERGEIAGYLKGRDTDRLAAIQEMVWALLSSTEFRFNH
jgi:hypothetical protein